MATKRNGEKYFGEALHVPLSGDGQVSAYVWPLRVLGIAGKGVGGPTIGIDVGNEEVVRFDCHDNRGHWHCGGYDRLGSPGNSQRRFPEDLTSVPAQVGWSLRQIQERLAELLEESEQGPAAQSVDPVLVQVGVAAIQSHLDKHRLLRAQAIADNLIAV